MTLVIILDSGSAESTLGRPLAGEELLKSCTNLRSFLGITLSSPLLLLLHMLVSLGGRYQSSSALCRQVLHLHRQQGELCDGLHQFIFGPIEEVHFLQLLGELSYVFTAE